MPLKPSMSLHQIMSNLSSNPMLQATNVLGQDRNRGKMCLAGLSDDDDGPVVDEYLW